MKLGDKWLTPLIAFTDTKANIEAISNPQEGMWAQQTDDPYAMGRYANGAWTWVSGSASGGGVTAFQVNGRLAVADNPSPVILITADTTIDSWLMYLETLGTSGSTIIDVILKRVGEADLSIFDGGTMPEIQWDDADNLVIGTPTTTDFLAGDILELNIEQIAPEAAQLTFAATSAGGGGGGTPLVVADGSTTVDPVTLITIVGAVVSDEGSGEAKITIPAPVATTIIQIVEADDNTLWTGSGTFPFDDTIPQNTEGTEFITQAITPTDSANYLDFDFCLFACVSSADWFLISFFQDTTANAVYSTAHYIGANNGGATLHVKFRMLAGTTSATTFKVRLGTASGATVTVNGQSGSRIFGGANLATLMISEVKA